MKSLTVLYDASCVFCLRVKAWLNKQPQLVPLVFLAQQHPQVEERYPELVLKTDAHDKPEEMIVISDEGAVYRGTAAYLMTLYALKQYRPLAFKLSTPTMRPLARRVFAGISRQRDNMSRLLQAKSRAQIKMLLPLEEGADSCHKGQCDRP